MKNSLSRFLKILLSFSVFFIVSCFSMTEDLLFSGILGYTSDTISENMKTLDPSATYSKRAATMLTLLGDEAKMKKLNEKYSGVVDFVLRAKRDNVLKMQLATENDPINLFLVYPKTRILREDERYPVVLFSHGGGFELHDFSVYENVVTSLAESTGCVILFYEYRLAPEHKFPAAVNDTYATYKWLMNDAAAKCYKLDNKNIVFLGESSGGNLMAGLALRVAENNESNARSVILLYPSLDVTESMNASKLLFSGLENPDKYYVTNLKYLTHVLNIYLEDKKDGYKPYASPLIMLEGLIDVEGYDNPYAEYKTTLTPPLNLPPHFIAVPEIDTLRDEAKSYHALLKIFGCESTLKEYEGMFHGFFTLKSFVGKSKDLYDDVVNVIKEITKVDDLGKSNETNEFYTTSLTIE